MIGTRGREFKLMMSEMMFSSPHLNANTHTHTHTCSGDTIIVAHTRQTLMNDYCVVETQDEPAAAAAVAAEATEADAHHRF